MTWYTLFSRPLALTGGDSNGSNIRQHIPVSAYSIGAPPSGVAFRVTWRAATGGGLNISSAYGGHVATSGDLLDFDGTQVQVLNASSGASFSMAAGAEQLSAPAAYAFSKLKGFVLSGQITFPGNVLRGADPDIKSGLASGGVGATDITSSTLASEVAFPKVEVEFIDPPGAPTATLTKNLGQADPTSGTSIEFKVQFNKGVTGFTAADVNLSASTVTWFGGSPTVSIVGSDFAFIVTVGGMLTGGNVTMSIPAAAVTAVADGEANTASGTISVVWDPDLIDPRAPAVFEVCTVNRNMLRLEVRDPPVIPGYVEELSTPDAGEGTFPITNIVNNGKGLIRVTTTTEFVSSLITNLSIFDMTNNGSGLIRCTVFSTAGLPSQVGITGAMGTFEANNLDFSTWTINIINSTQFDLFGSTFVNTYLGNGMVNLSHHWWQRVAIHSVLGTTEANGAFVCMKAGTNVVDLLDSHFVNTYVSGGTIVNPYIWCQRPNPSKGGDLDYCQIPGRTAMRRRFQDIGPGGQGLALGEYFNRDAAIIPSNYTLSGGLTVSAIYRKIKPYSGGVDASAAVSYDEPTTSSRIYVYLQLSGNLVSGTTYILQFHPELNLPPKTFVFNDKQTRMSSIHVDQNGHRPADPGKLGYLAETVPDLGVHGGMDYSDITAWHLINEAGTIVATFGAPVLRVSPTTIEGASIAGPGGAEPIAQPPFMNRQGPPMKLSGATRAAVCTVTVDSTALVSNGSMVAFSDMWHWAGARPPTDGGHVGMWEIESDINGTPVFFKVVNKTATTFQLSAIKGVRTNPTVASGGTGYALNDVIILNNFVRLKVGAVSGSTITSVLIIQNEEFEGWSFPYSGGTGRIDYPYSIPSNPQGQISTSGSGTGATFNLVWVDNWGDRTTVPGGFTYGNPNTTAAHLFDTTEAHNRGNLCYRVNELGNRAGGAWVYGLDYSLFTTAGIYNIYFPNIGVSDPIHISQSRWQRAAQLYLKGIYHLRSGCEIDGRFGYSRPDGIRNRAGHPVYKSYLPYALSSYSLEPTFPSLPDITGRNTSQFGGGGYGPWITNVPAPQYGSHEDAGDYDTRFDETCWGYWQILEAWLACPPTAHAAFYNMGTPTCLEIGLDPVVFAGTDGLPSPIVEVIWGCEQCRQSQEPSGAVSCGTNYGEGVLGFETTDNMAMSLYAWFPDHETSFTYAMVTAKLARVLIDLGYTGLAATYQASALAAYNWASNIQLNTSARDAYYAPVKARSTWTTAQYDAAMGYLQSKTARNRAHAAASLFHLTGSSTYKTVCDAFYNPAPSVDVRTSTGAWEYATAPGADEDIRDDVFNKYADKAIVTFVENCEALDISYVTSLPKGIWNMAFGWPNQWNLNMPILQLGAQVFDNPDDPNYSPTNAMRCRRAMQWAAAFRHGANQTGLCLTKGLGVRHNEEATHLDSVGLGQPLPVGICSEAFSNNFPGLPLTLGDSDISRIQHQQYDSTNLITDPTVPYREMYPWDQLCWGRLEFFVENHIAIEHAEYTVQQQLLPALSTSIYLTGFDGNAAVEAGLATATVELSSSLNPSTDIDAVTFSVIVSGDAGTPTGTVTFKDEGVTIGGPLTLSGGVQSFVSSPLTEGIHTISVLYSGDVNYDPASDFLSQTVGSTVSAGPLFPPRLAMKMRLHR